MDNEEIFDSFDYVSADDVGKRDGIFEYSSGMEDPLFLNYRN